MFSIGGFQMPSRPNADGLAPHSTPGFHARSRVFQDDKLIHRNTQTIRCDAIFFRARFPARDIYHREQNVRKRQTRYFSADSCHLPYRV